MTKIVKITQASGRYYWYRDMIGEVVEVKDDLLDCFTGMRYVTLDGEFVIAPADVEVIADNKEPADSKSIEKLRINVDVKDEAQDKVLDLISNLSAHVVKLERRLADVEEQADSNKKDVVTLAEEATKSARMNNGSIFV